MKVLYELLNKMVITGELQQNHEDETELEIEAKRSAFDTWKLLNDLMK